MFGDKVVFKDGVEISLGKPDRVKEEENSVEIIEEKEKEENGRCNQT